MSITKENHEIIKIMAIKPYIITDDEEIDWKKLNEETK